MRVAPHIEELPIPVLSDNLAMKGISPTLFTIFPFTTSKLSSQQTPRLALLQTISFNSFTQRRPDFLKSPLALSSPGSWDSLGCFCKQNLHHSHRQDCQASDWRLRPTTRAGRCRIWSSSPFAASLCSLSVQVSSTSWSFCNPAAFQNQLKKAPPVSF